MGRNIAEIKSTQVIRAAEVKTIKNGHLSTSAPSIDRRDLAVYEQNVIERQEKILRSFHIEAVGLDIAAEESAGDMWRENKALTVAGEKDVVARVVNKRWRDLA